MTVLTVDFEMAFWSARSGYKQTILLLISFLLIFIQLCDSRKIHYLTLEFRVKLHLKTDIALIESLRDSCDIGFRVQFYNAEFPHQVMNFPIIYIDLSLVSI